VIGTLAVQLFFQRVKELREEARRSAGTWTRSGASIGTGWTAIAWFDAAQVPGRKGWQEITVRASAAGWKDLMLGYKDALTVMDDSAACEAGSSGSSPGTPAHQSPS